ncbi:MAG: rod shape-determining protein MreC [Clostridia bacterium]|nr:rod shape-determining protein MreC [Clostridia bacterium]
MRFFFRSRKFKIMLGITAGVLVLALVSLFIKNSVMPQNSVIGAITTRIQSYATGVSNWCSDIFKKMGDNEKLMLENAELKAQINDLNSKLVDYQSLQQENEFYKKYLEIKEKNPDYVMEPADLISRNAEDPYGSFVINKGSLNGVALYDPVITEAGLVGYIGEVNPSYSKVITILDANIKCGGMDKRTKDVGIVSGELTAAEAGKTKMINLLRSSGVATGDFIVTPGGEVFPEGIVIGTVDSIHNSKTDISLYAVITPVVDFKELREVMVITYFSGQKAEGGAAND